MGEYLPRSTDNADGQGGDYSTFNLSTATFSNGTSIPNGDYQCECSCRLAAKKERKKLIVSSPYEGVAHHGG